MPDTNPSPTIQSALEEFARERQQLSENQSRIVQRVLFFLALCINNYGHRNLDDEERDECERHFYAQGEAQRHFFEVFGPEKLLPELDFFRGAYLKSDVQTTDQVEKKASSVVTDLRQWLVAKGYLDHETLAVEEARAMRRQSRMRQAKKAKRQLEALVSVERLRAASGDSFVPCDHHLAARIDPGKIWLRVYRGPAAERIGPIDVPREVSETLEVGWSLCAALHLVGRRWRLVELSEIYPRG